MLQITEEDILWHNKQKMNINVLMNDQYKNVSMHRSYKLTHFSFYWDSCSVIFNTQFFTYLKRITSFTQNHQSSVLPVKKKI